MAEAVDKSIDVARYLIGPGQNYSEEIKKSIEEMSRNHVQILISKLMDCATDINSSNPIGYDTFVSSVNEVTITWKRAKNSNHDNQ